MLTLTACRLLDLPLLSVFPAIGDRLPSVFAGYIDLAVDVGKDLFQIGDRSLVGQQKQNLVSWYVHSVLIGLL